MENIYFQETQEGSGFDSGDGNHHTGVQVGSVHHCTVCGGSLKRRSPSSSSLRERKSKKITHHPSSSSAAAVGNGCESSLQGFTKLPLPITSPIVWALPTFNPTPSFPTLRRCISDPVNSPGTNDARASGAQLSDSSAVSGVFLKPLSPENSKITASATTPSPGKATSSASATLPHPSPILRRSISDPSPTACQVNTTPPDSIKGETPNSKRLKEMKDRMREMSHWWDEVIREGEEDGGSEDTNNGDPIKLQDESETESEEAVSVERTGNCLIIHIKCPCGKGYQILISGKNCYYKLM